MLLVILGAILMSAIIIIVNTSNDNKAEIASKYKAQYDKRIANLRMDCDKRAHTSVGDQEFQKAKDMKDLYDFYYDSCIRAVGQDPAVIKNLETNIVYTYE